MSSKNNRFAFYGFSFFEFLIVVAIIGVLTAIAIPAYGVYVSRSKANEMFRGMQDLKKAVADYKALNNEFVNASDSETILEIYKVEDPAKAYAVIDKVEINSSSPEKVSIHAISTGTSLSLKQGQSLELILTGNWSENGIEWECTSKGQTKYAPLQCRSKEEEKPEDKKNNKRK